MPRKTRIRGLPRDVDLPASMRPRPDATENIGGTSEVCVTASGFNEAAARCHGKPWRGRRGRAQTGCFNEAAARCHGKRSDASAPMPGL